MAIDMTGLVCVVTGATGMAGAGARALAQAHYTLGNYDVIAVYFPDLGGVSSSQPMSSSGKNDELAN